MDTFISDIKSQNWALVTSLNEKMQRQTPQEKLLEYKIWKDFQYLEASEIHLEIPQSQIREQLMVPWGRDANLTPKRQLNTIQ